MLMNEYIKNNECKSGYIILKLYSNFGYFKISNKIVVFDSKETAYYYINHTDRLRGTRLEVLYYQYNYTDNVIEMDMDDIKDMEQNTYEKAYCIEMRYKLPFKYVNYNNKIALFDTADTATLYMHFLEDDNKLGIPDQWYSVSIINVKNNSKIFNMEDVKKMISNYDCKTYALYSYGLGSYYFINGKIAIFNNLEDVNTFIKSIDTNDFVITTILTDKNPEKYLLIENLNNENKFDEYIRLNKYKGIDLKEDTIKTLLIYEDDGSFVKYNDYILSFNSEESANKFAKDSNIDAFTANGYVSKSSLQYLNADNCFYMDNEFIIPVTPDDKINDKPHIIGMGTTTTVSLSADTNNIYIIPDNGDAEKITIPFKCISSIDTKEIEKDIMKNMAKLTDKILRGEEDYEF